MNSSQIHVVEVGKKKELQLQIDVPIKKGSVRIRIPKDQASPEIKGYIDNPTKVKGSIINVEFEGVGVQVERVRLAGQPWVEPPPAPTTKQNPGNAPKAGAAMFENPYNFIPAPPRNTEHETLGDAIPAGHHRYHADKWSGRISIALTTVTPLQIPDSGVKENGHKTFGIRTDENGAPYLPPTSIKGILRTAYEAVTNSRMGVLEDHKDPLAIRYPAQSGASVVPARVSDDGQHVDILAGFTRVGNSGVPQSDIQYGAWIPTHGNAKNLLQAGGEFAALPFHGKQVWARLELWEHHIQKKRIAEWKNNFNFWRVVEIQDSETEPTSTGTQKISPCNGRPLGMADYNRSFSNPKQGIPHKWVRGWIVVTNKNMLKKHDERLFFVDEHHSQIASLKNILINDNLKERWRALITNYQVEHEEEIKKGMTRPPALSNDCLFSRHIIGGHKERSLSPNTLCYAVVEIAPSGGVTVKGLYPVMISRDLYSQSPADLLSPSFLKPAEALDQLSPADRVFGWVSSKKGHGQFKGQLRIGAVTCVQGAAAIEKTGDAQGVPLTILGAPKPAQARFYAAKNPKGEPLGQGAEKAKAYGNGQGLRGRKVYPHQNQTSKNDYWNATTQNAEAITEKLGGQTVYREWQRLAETPGKIRTEQNRSITAWVKPKMTFNFDVDVTNLSSVELGALLWLLNQPDQRYFRLGGGKPLGFGSATLKITSLDLRDGEAIKADYVAFGEPSADGQRINSIEAAKQPLIEEYKKALPLAVGEPAQPFDELRIIKAFVNAAQGGDLPVHYPRTTIPPNPQGENFRWFVANEGNGQKNSLPDLADASRKLPILGG